MSLMFAKSFTATESGGGGGRKSGGRKGLMGKGKSHHGGRGQQHDSSADHGSSGIINMDPDSNYRTHMLFPGGKRDEEEGGGGGGTRSSGSPSFMKTVFGAGWGRRAPPGGIGAPQPQQHPDLRYRVTPEIDPFLRGAKQVSFGGEDWSHGKPERKPNSYNCDAPTTEGRSGSGYIPPYPEVQRENEYASFGPNGRPVNYARHSSCDPYVNGSGPPVDASGRLKPPGSVARSVSMESGTPRPPGGIPPRARGSRTPVPREETAMKAQEEAAMRHHHHFHKDCFIIPQENVERFLPDGITLPRGPSRNQLINILEVDDPKLAIIFHMMAPLTSLTPHLDSPLSSPMVLLRKLAQEEMARAKELKANEGFLLKNLEKDSEYPYINYFVIQKPRAEASELFKEARSQSYEAFSPTKLGYNCAHTFDKYDEVATIARPPYEPLSKKPNSELTGYIVCVYRVFKGDDGQKFERNWLYWTGARMLYKNLPKAVGLRRITLHKSVTLNQEVVYFLLVECSHFMDHIGETANLLPVLRARICGYTGIFRVAESF